MSASLRFKLSIIILTGVILLSPIFSISAQTSTVTPPSDTQSLIKQLQDLVKSLQSQINDLKTQLKAAKGEIEEVKAEVKELKITQTLTRGSKGDEVTQLQEFLKQNPEIYPEGLVTGFFGPATETAVKRFQEKHGIESIGIIGPKTRAKLNELFTKAGESEVTPPGTS